MDANLMQRIALGDRGNTLIKDTALHSGDWQVLDIKDDITITTLTIANSDVSYAGEVFTAPGQILGHITAIELVSGRAIAYKR